MAASKRGVRVVEVPSGSPAAEAGLREGDMLLEVDGRSIAGLKPHKLHELLTGEVGSSVLLRVDRDGEQRELRVTRAPYGK